MADLPRVLDVLARVTENERVLSELDLLIYEQQIIDSLGTVELIVSLGEAFNLDISPADVDLKDWATPRLLMADVERRLSHLS
jgi:D-alanine--poly(phosphoribitol) ligase subunit 2